MPEINSGDTAWVLASAALVMFMTPGLAFFYAGFVRSKNVVGTIMHSFIVIGLVGVLWILIGYTLAFAPSEGGIIGNLDFIGLKDVVMQPLDPSADSTIPIASTSTALIATITWHSDTGGTSVSETTSRGSKRASPSKNCWRGCLTTSS